MLTLYLVRHGQTPLSRDGSFCGTLDAPLTEDGKRMAQALAEHYASVPFEGVYASNMARAIQTAQPLAERLKLPVVTDAGLGEIAYGDWEGMNEEEVHRNHRGAYEAWTAKPDLVSPPGGETAVQIAARAGAAVERIQRRHREGPVLVVSHKATIRILLCTFLGIPAGEFRRKIGQPVAAVSQVHFKPTGPLLQVMGDTSHLPPDLREAQGT